MHTNGESGRLTISGLDPEIIRLFKSRAALKGLSLAEYFTLVMHEREESTLTFTIHQREDIRGGRPGL